MSGKAYTLKESVITLKDLPEKYHQYPTIGYGFTSMVLDYSDTEVLMVTRDKYKVKWLLQAGLGEIVDKIKGEPLPADTTSNAAYLKAHREKYRELTAYVILMPKLRELSQADIDHFSPIFRRLRMIKEKFISDQIDKENKGVNYERNPYLSKLYKVFKKKAMLYTRKALVGTRFYNNESLEKCVKFIVDHLDDMYEYKFRLDMHEGNFMKTSTGEILVTDPIVTRELLSIDKYDKRLPELPYEPTKQIGMGNKSRNYTAPVTPVKWNERDESLWNKLVNEGKETQLFEEAIKVTEIPPRYRKWLRFLASGATSIVMLDLDRPDEVIMFTRDYPKVKWLVHAGIGQVIEEFDGEDSINKNKRYAHMPIVAIRMPRLSELSGANATKIQKIIKWANITLHQIPHGITKRAIKRTPEKFARLLSKFGLKTNNIDSLNKLIEFVFLNPPHGDETGKNMYKFDIRYNNIMEDNDGNIVFLDPIISKEIWNIELPLEPGQDDPDIKPPSYSPWVDYKPYRDEIKEGVLEPAHIPPNIYDKYVKTKTGTRDLLGLGHTSLVYKYNNDHVIMFTRDRMKIKWLLEAGIAEVIDKGMQDVRDRGQSDHVVTIPIYVLLVERLLPLNRHTDDDTYEKIQKFIYELEDVITNRFYNSKVKKKYHDGGLKLVLTRLIGKNKFAGWLKRYLEKNNISFITPEHLNKFANFVFTELTNRQFGLDLHTDNVMMNKEGKLIFSDPIVSNELLACRMYKPTLNHIDFTPNNRTLDETLTEGILDEEHIPPRLFDKYINTNPRRNLLGKGYTSIVYEYDDEHVLMFCRDRMKIKWLLHAGIAEVIDKGVQESDNRFQNKYVASIPIYVLLVDKLKKIEKGDEDTYYIYSTISSFTSNLGDLINGIFRPKVSADNPTPMDGRRYEKYYGPGMREVLTKMIGRKKFTSWLGKFLKKRNLNFVNIDHLIKFSNFLFNELKTGGFAADLHMENVMLNSSGELVFSDPIVSKELMTYFDNEPKLKHIDFEPTRTVESASAPRSLDKKDWVERMKSIVNRPVEFPTTGTSAQEETEDTSLGRVIHRTQYTPKYRKFAENHTLLGRGFTSEVYAYDESHVLMFTKDKAKIRWLIHAGMAEVVDRFMSANPDKSGFDDYAHLSNLPIYVLLVTKLYPVPNDNYAKIIKIMQMVNNFFSDKSKEKTKKFLNTKKYRLTIRKLMASYGVDFVDTENFAKFMEYVHLYEPPFSYRDYDTDYRIDIHPMNIMMNSEGKLVLSDPVVSREVFGPKETSLAHLIFPVTKNSPISENQQMSLFEVAVEPEEIPDEYRHLPRISNGSTSQVYDYDSKHVLMLTRDEPKVRWLLHSGLGEELERYDTQNDKYHDMPIYVMLVEKLFPLSEEQEDIAWKIESVFMKYTRSSDDNKARVKKVIDRNKLTLLAKKVIDRSGLQFINRDSYENFCDFIVTYGVESDYHFDLMSHNFLQNAEGEIVLADPIISKEVLSREHSNYYGVGTKPKMVSDRGFVFN